MTPGRTQRPYDTHAGSRQAGAVPLKQERARATLASIEATAVRLWNASGYDRVSVDAICDAAGISKGAFYFHFASKAELLHAVAVPDTARLVERTREALDDGTPPVLILVGQIVTWVADDIRQVPASLVERAVLGPSRWSTD